MDHGKCCGFKQVANPLLWQRRELVPGQTMTKPQAPFNKLDPDLVKAETGESA